MLPNQNRLPHRLLVPKPLFIGCGLLHNLGLLNVVISVTLRPNPVGVTFALQRP